MNDVRAKGAMSDSPGPSRRRFRLSVVVALVLGLFAAYNVVVVVLAVSSGRPHASVFWPTVVLMLILAAWIARRARHLLQRSKD